MNSTLIATASNARFFKLLAGLLLSLEAQRESREVDIGLFDLGLTTAQRNWVDTRITSRVEPGWDLDVPDVWRSEKSHLRALVVRPFLPRHFPGYDTYIWIDADVWLQDWRGIELYSIGAQHSDLTITPHTDRAYPFNRAVSGHSHREFTLAYGKATADDLAPRQNVNAGIFSARADSSLWVNWAAAYQQAIHASAGVMTSDQTALNFACYRQGLKVQLLQALYNWQCHLAVPVWNPKTERFCEPHLPYAPISMMHLTHTSKNQVYDVQCLDGSTRKMTLHQPKVALSDLPTAKL